MKPSTRQHFAWAMTMVALSVLISYTFDDLNLGAAAIQLTLSGLVWLIVNQRSEHHES